MDDIKKRAVEHLAEAYRRKGQPGLASLMIEREGRTNNVWGDVALNAIVAALTPPEGFALVPVEPTEAMVEASMIRVDLAKRCGPGTLKVLGARAWSAMLDAYQKELK